MILNNPCSLACADAAFSTIIKAQIQPYGCITSRPNLSLKFLHQSNKCSNKFTVLYLQLSDSPINVHLHITVSYCSVASLWIRPICWCLSIVPIFVTLSDVILLCHVIKCYTLLQQVLRCGLILRSVLKHRNDVLSVLKMF
jgi:hypothetical protein